jgi:hypothetical protein
MPPTPTLPLPRRKPDAVRCHRHYPPGKVEDARHAALKAEFAPLLGSKLVYTRHYGAHESFIAPTADDAQGRGLTVLFPTGHPRQGQDRYEWLDRGDGVLYGYLVPDDTDPELASAGIAAFHEKKAAETQAFLDSPEGLDFLKARFAAMVAKGLIGPDEVPEEYRADA